MDSPLCIKLQTIHKHNANSVRLQHIPFKNLSQFRDETEKGVEEDDGYYRFLV